MLPVNVPDLPTPLRLGWRGPLVMAIILSRVGRIGPIIWYMPAHANIAFRELGILLFLSCVGLKAGEHFFATMMTANGLVWLATATVVTALPLLVVGIVARRVLKLNFTSISGLIAGSMTDPPALAFANSIARSDAPSLSYATVYPVTMLLRILAAQVIVLFFCR